jgi:hypothetical protein
MAQGTPRYYLYRHIRHDINSVFYVGVGTTSSNHLGFPSEYKRAYDKNRRSAYWKNIVNKTTYDVEILFETTDLITIKEKEREFISLYGRKDLGKGSLVNHNDGGVGLEGSKHTPEAKLKISQANIGRKPTMLGKTQTMEAKLKISLANQGKKLTAEQVKMLSIRNSGSNNHRAKLTDTDVIDIRSKYSSGKFTQTQLANMFGTDQGTISCIVRGKKWKHIF